METVVTLKKLVMPYVVLTIVKCLHVLLDLFSAFYTEDHILLSRLQVNVFTIELYQVLLFLFWLSPGHVTCPPLALLLVRVPHRHPSTHK